MTVTPQKETVEVYLLPLIAVGLPVAWGVPAKLVQQLLQLLQRLEEVVEALAVLVAVAVADKENPNELQSL